MRDYRRRGTGKPQLSTPVSPITRLSMEIHHSDYDHHLIRNRVNQSVRELFDKTSMERTVQRSPSLRKFKNAFDGGVDLFREHEAETWLLKFVVVNTIEEFVPRRLGKLVSHF